jgi:hypothetical protein
MVGIVSFAAQSFIKPRSAEVAWDSDPFSKARRMSEYRSHTSASFPSKHFITLYWFSDQIETAFSPSVALFSRPYLHWFLNND